MLLDTTILIDFLRGKDKAVNFINHLDKDLIFTTEINVFELITGIYASKQDIKTHLEKVVSMLSNFIILPLDRKSTFKAAEIAGNLIKKGEKIQETDCLIAGICLSNGILDIATENGKHFSKIKDIRVRSY